MNIVIILFGIFLEWVIIRKELLQSDRVTEKLALERVYWLLAPSIMLRRNETTGLRCMGTCQPMAYFPLGKQTSNISHFPNDKILTFSFIHPCWYLLLQLLLMLITILLEFDWSKNYPNSDLLTFRREVLTGPCFQMLYFGFRVSKIHPATWNGGGGEFVTPFYTKIHFKRWPSG